MKRLLAITSVTVVAGLGGFATTAAADYLYVVMPCGCGPLHAGQQGFDTYSQPVDVSSGSPAESNPSGSVGSADTTSGPGPTGNGLSNPSGQAQFCATSGPC